MLIVNIDRIDQTSRHAQCPIIFFRYQVTFFLFIQLRIGL